MCIIKPQSHLADVIRRNLTIAIMFKIIKDSNLKQENMLKCYTCVVFMDIYISLNINIKVISQYQFVCTHLSSKHTHTSKIVGVWANNKLVHTNQY